MNARAFRMALAVALAVGGIAWSGVTALQRGPGHGAPHTAGTTGQMDWRERAAGPGIVPFPQPGSRARELDLPVLHAEEPWLRGDSLSLADLRGRWVYLDVFGTWCGPCQEKYPSMDRIARDVEEAGGTVVGLLLEDRPRTAAAWFAEHGGMTYPFLVLDDETVRTWRIMGAPMGFLISPDGLVVRRCVGCAHDGERIEDLADEIRALDR